jgi:hypothetical protein
MTLAADALKFSIKLPDVVIAREFRDITRLPSLCHVVLLSAGTLFDQEAQHRTVGGERYCCDNHA